MVVVEGGSLVDPPPGPIVVTMFVTNPSTPIDDRILVAIKMGSLTVDNPLVTPQVKEVTVNGSETTTSPNKPGEPIPKSKDPISHDEEKDKGTPDDGMIVKGWKNVVVGNPQGGVDPNYIHVCVQTKEGTTIEISDTVMDRIMLNMSNTLVGKKFLSNPLLRWFGNGPRPNGG